MKFLLISGLWQQPVEADTLDLAKAMADDSIGYNQSDMKIQDNEGQLIAFREWCSTSDGFWEQKSPVDYGSFGYYTDWKEG